MTTLATPIIPVENRSKRLSFMDYQNLTDDLEATRAAAFANLCETLERICPEAIGMLQDVSLLAYFVHTSQCRILQPKEIITAQAVLQRARRRAVDLQPSEESSHDKPSKLA